LAAWSKNVDERSLSGHVLRHVFSKHPGGLYTKPRDSAMLEACLKLSLHNTLKYHMKQIFLNQKTYHQTSFFEHQFHLWNQEFAESKV
jgi:hypothetical protein